MEVTPTMLETACRLAAESTALALEAAARGDMLRAEVFANTADYWTELAFTEAVAR